MKTLLQINTSLFSNQGESSKLTQEFVNQWLAANRDGRLISRDLSKEPVPHLNAERFTAFLTPVEQRNVEQQAVVAYSDMLIEELKQADDIVFGVPMYNFDIPSTLKAYFDHIARSGITFKYSPQGPVGLLTNKKAYVFSTRGGVHAGTHRDTQNQYMQNFLSFIGINEVTFVNAEGVSLGETNKQAALNKAQHAIATLLHTELRAA